MSIFKSVIALIKVLFRFLLLTLFIQFGIDVAGKTPPISDHLSEVPPPRIIRTCCSFGTDLKITGLPFIRQSDISCVNELGDHEYLGNKTENNGIIYTNIGGFIDVGHLRDCADWTAYLYSQIISTKEIQNSLELVLGIEGGQKTLSIKNLDLLNNDEIIQIAGKIAYDLSVWHEIATWYGASYVPFYPEGYSSFSPEDLYSNLLGVHIGIKAIKSGLEYDEAMTHFISKTLNELDAVSSMEETILAMESVEDIWWTREKNIPSKKVLLKRYMGIGQSLSPWLMPNQVNLSENSILQKPDKQLTELYKLEIKLNYKFPLRNLEIEHSKRTIDQSDFDSLVECITQDLINRELKVKDRLGKISKRKERKLMELMKMES